MAVAIDRGRRRRGVLCGLAAALSLAVAGCAHLVVGARLVAQLTGGR